MRVIFAGTPDFAAAHLSALINSRHKIVGVYTQPDRPAGRGRQLKASPVKELAQQYQLPIFQPPKLDDIAQQQLRNLKADIMVVAAYGLILPKATLNIPKQGCINVHASLLPRWRGASPIQHAILAGDSQSGVTIMQINEGLDTGDMLYLVNCPISSTDTAATLHDKLSLLGPIALMQTLDQFETTSAIPQDDNEACYAPKITKEQAKINWQQTAVEINRQIRAFNPWPVAHTTLDKNPIRIWQAAVINTNTAESPGTIINSEQHIDVATGKGVLRISKLQLPGGKALTSTEALNGKRELFKNKRFE